MEMKGALTRINPSPLEGEGRGEGGHEDLRYYLSCPLRKGGPRIAVTVCNKQKCIWLTSDGGKLRCGYGDPNASLGNRPRVRKIERDGLK